MKDPDEFCATPDEAVAVEHLRGVVVSFEGGEEWCYLDGAPPPTSGGDGRPLPQYPPQQQTDLK